MCALTVQNSSIVARSKGSVSSLKIPAFFLSFCPSLCVFRVFSDVVSFIRRWLKWHKRDCATLCSCARSNNLLGISKFERHAGVSLDLFAIGRDKRKGGISAHARFLFVVDGSINCSSSSKEYFPVQTRLDKTD